MRKIKESKWTYVILSVLVAVILWLYVGADLDVETTVELHNIPVVFEGEEDLADRGLMITEGANQTVDLKLRVKRNTAFFKFNNDTVSVVVDVSKIEEPSEYTTAYRLVTSGTVSSSGITDLSEERNITFTVSRRTERNVEVQGRLAPGVEVAEGYQVGEFSIVPGTITVSGEASTVNQVDHALVTVASEEPLSESYSGDLPIQLLDVDGNVLDMAALHLETDVDTVQVTLPVVQTKEVKLKVDLKSGGGATLPGGECLAQDIGYLVELCRLLREEGVHVAADTCGAAPRAHLEQLLPYVDLWLYDIKAADEATHRALAGAPNGAILENLAYLAGCGARIIVRMPVVEPVNSGDDDIIAAAEAIASHAGLCPVSLLPYHTTGNGKYARLGRAAPSGAFRVPSAQTMEHLRDLLRERGFSQVEIGG